LGFKFVFATAYHGKMITPVRKTVFNQTNSKGHEI